jgi:hypothetical protein
MADAGVSQGVALLASEYLLLTVEQLRGGA